ncbi:hypothetical protein HA402_000451 [Bradysia odoriphaga]|nr:hypothetical protein HA402_000451 [Bradysia odoriphaga]
MNRDKDKTNPKRKSLLNILSRRSTKVEPHTDSVQTNPDEKSVSVQSTPIKQYHQSSVLRRHNSSQTLTTDPAKNSNRFSHQFNLCCSIESATSLSPNLHKSSETKPSQDTCHRNGNVAKDEPVVIVHKSPDNPNEINVLVQQQQGPISDTDVKKEAPKPVFSEYQSYQSSIAMSACRSRFRQKLLPPGISIDLASNEQHFSSPNISEKPSDEVIPNNNRSMSFDVLTGRPSTASADSLAKQSLIAAQLLHLIPVERARERNYLAGCLAINSLFGPAELDRVLPTREVKIFVGTWNMNEHNPPKLMNDFVLPSGIDHIPDLVAIGTQESCSERFEWEVSLQETLGPTHILLHSAGLGTLHLAVFIRRDLIWFCSVPEDDSLSVRPGTAFRTKGAVAISFCLFGTTMLFVTSHLTAHQQKVKERVSDVKRIIHSLDLPRNLNIKNKNRDVTQNFDCVYWSGDLNFRLGEPREKVLKWIETTKFPLPAHLPNGYMHTDQLKSVLSNGAAFKDFKEANITFPPTYKYDPGTQQFDTSSKQRAPAYTDRILLQIQINADWHSSRQQFSEFVAP